MPPGHRALPHVLLPSIILLPSILLAACGDPAVTTASQSGGDSSGSGTAQPQTTGDSSGASTGTGTVAPTTGDGSGGVTDGMTSSGPTTTTTVDPVTTEPVDSETGPPGTSTGPDPGTTTTTGPDPDTTTGGGSSSEGGEDSSTGDAVACACPDIEVPLDDGIFLLSDTAELWKYFPETNDFVMLGEINCGGLLFGTFSMAVDRLGFAWVQFSGDGALRKVDVTNVANCSDPGYIPGQLGVDNFGMAFVSNSQFDACDRIYGNTYSGLGGYTEGPMIGDFITIDPDTLDLTKLGKTNFDGAEVTGTGDGRAFIFGGANPSKLVEMDKAKGMPVKTTPLNGLEINNGAFAFAFFAGDFYFFTDSDNDFFNSEVTHMDYDDSDKNGKQDLTVLDNDAPLLVVGAGVSTCAPTVPL